jgi:uncharacterized membrane protein YfcA
MADSTIRPPQSASVVTPIPSADIAKTASALRFTGWISFWFQFVVAIVSGVILAIAMFSRSIDGDTQTASTGFSIFLAGCSIVALLFTLATSFRYTRLARQFRRRPPSDHPTRPAITRVLVIGLIAGLIGALIGLIGSEVGIGILLAKALSQPQGAAIYTPDKIIRILDILVPLVNINLVAAHVVNTVASLWLIRQLQE